MYSNISLCVRVVMVLKYISPCFMSPIGVRQWDNLRLTLFNLFVNDDLPDIFNAECEPAIFGDIV